MCYITDLFLIGILLLTIHCFYKTYNQEQMTDAPRFAWGDTPIIWHETMGPTYATVDGTSLNVFNPAGYRK